jgi:3-phosphoshikimate 1-carboxyvinyltransferase
VEIPSKVKINKIKGIKGEITVPGDKSISHRAIILNSIARGAGVIKNFLESDDCLRTLAALKQSGVDVSRDKQNNIIINGKGLHSLKEAKDIIDMGNSGTGIRLMTGILSGHSFLSILTGDESIRKRPMDRIIKPLKKMGANILGRKGNQLAPIVIKGGNLKAIEYTLPVASAQVKSAILFAGLYAEGKTKILEPIKSRNHSELMLDWFGAKIIYRGNEIEITGRNELNAQEIFIPGDISSAAFFIILALITKKSEILIKNVSINLTRCGILKILNRMGAKIEIINKRKVCGEEMGDIYVRSCELKATTIREDEVPFAIDEFPILTIAACFAQGQTKILGAKELRYKESDRIKTMVSELRKFGVMAEELEDGMIIHGGSPVFGTNCKSHGDHRVAMSLIIAGMAAIGTTTIEDTYCIKTSLPSFFDLLYSLSFN